jgi:hypothetical protein
VEYVLLDGKKYALDIQIHNFIPPVLLIHFIEIRAPRRARICKQDIYMVGVFVDFLHESLDVGDLAAVGGNGVGPRVGGFVGEHVEGCDGFVTG